MREIHVSNVPYAANESDLRIFLESVTGPKAVCACELRRESFNTAHKGFGFVTFVEDDMAEQVRYLASYPYQLRFQGRALKINISKRPIRHNPGFSTIQLEGSSLSMGCLTGETLHVLWSTDNDLEIEVDFRERKLYIKLSVGPVDGNDWEDFAQVRPTLKLEFRFKYIYYSNNAKIKGRPTRACALLLEVYNPPHVYLEEGQANPLEDCLSFMSLFDFNQPRRTWVRTVDFTPNRSIGQSHAYVLEFAGPSANFSKILENLADFKLAGTNIRLLDLQAGVPYADTTQILVPLLKVPRSIDLSFKVMFKLNYLVQVGELLGPSLNTRFFQLLSDATETQALWLLQNLRSYSLAPCEELERNLQGIRKGDIRIPTADTASDDGSIWVYRLLISPTKIYCIGPELEVSNRVTRQYIDVVDNFLRVSFIEEDYTNLSSQALSNTDNRGGTSNVYKRILSVLSQGFWLLGKHYEFLAFSQSQLREQSVWMFAPVGDLTANSIRAWMGNFLEIRNVAKCAARMGQCFSSTTKTLPVNSWEVENIRDIMSADGTYCFSDGIGMISMPFARQVAVKCGCSAFTPSAFQIRYAGSKGVVALDRECIHKLRIRPSMRKFESDHSDLEVISWTKRLPSFLNRQVIILLSTLGICDEVFEIKQDIVMSQLNEMVTDTSVALDLLQMTSSGETHRIAKQMLKAGYNPTSEPFLQSLLQAFRAFQLLELRTKSRILVSKGRTLMGCLDERRILNYGQIFLRVSSFPGNRSVLNDGLLYQDDGTCVVTGPVIVAKNPCLHPGDIRVLEAVGVPELHHMLDCVVFPQRGSRPHPNECSGSDLDGDLYFVSWDESLIPMQSDEPMDYTPVAPVEHPRAVSIEDIQRFFVNYMKSDSLGVISNAHLVHADKEPDMARDPKCLELANLFTVAVDFPKTGKPALMSSILRATTYPDFMEKDDKMSYESQRVLGKLFRAVLGESSGRTLIPTITRDSVVKSFDDDLIWEGFQNYISEARICKSWYDAKLVQLMNMYDIKSEAQALSGNILLLSKFYVKKQGEVRERINLAVRSIQNEAHKWFKHGCDIQQDQNQTDYFPPVLTENDTFAKASAWYHVTYHRRYLEVVEDGGNDLILLSFPWVVHDTLLAVKRATRARH